MAKSIKEPKYTVGFITFEKADNRAKNSVGSSRIRAKWVAKYWEGAEEWQLGKKYDVLIYQKVYWEHMMDNFEGIQILDLCDPDWLEGKDVMKFVARADAITTSTEALANYVRKYYPEKIIKCIPDRVDLAEHVPVKKKHSEKLKSLVWFGYSSNYKYLVDVFPKILDEKMSLTLFSDTGLKKGEDVKDLDLEFKYYDYPTLHKRLVKYDCAILPLRRIDERGQYKSNNKNLTCYALGLPVIEYPKDIDRLRDKVARETEAKEKLNLVKNKFDVKISVKEYKELIDEVVSRKKKNKRA